MRRLFAPILSAALLALSFSSPYESSAFDPEQLLPFSVSEPSPSLVKARLHPVLKTKSGHAFEGKPIPPEYYRLMNGRIHGMIMPFYLRNPGASYGRDSWPLRQVLAATIK